MLFAFTAVDERDLPFFGKNSQHILELVDAVDRAAGEGERFRRRLAGRGGRRLILQICETTTAPRESRETVAPSDA